MGRREQSAILGPDRGGGTKTDEAVVDFLLLDSARLVAKHGFRIAREFAWINSGLRHSIENLTADMFPVEGRADHRFERGLVETANLGLACCPDRRERDDIDLGADRLDACDGLGRQMPARSLPAGRGLCGADDRLWSRRKESCRSSAGTKADNRLPRPPGRLSAHRLRRFRGHASRLGPAFNAASVSTRTIWRSSLAK